MIDFSIIIPNYNGQKFLKKCFDSLKKQTFKNFEIILVDNNSSDDSINFCEKNYPEVKLIKMKSNGGFASAVNAGYNQSSGNLIALLNNDTEVDKDWLKEVKQAAESQPVAGFFASKMLDFEDRTIIDSCGDGLHWGGRSYNIGQLEKDNGNFDKDELVFGACAGAAIYRKEVFDKIGLLDDDFFMYLEDVDFDFRAQMAGFKCLFVSKAKVYHIGSATSGKRSAFIFKYSTKNRLHLIYKNYPTSKLFTKLPNIIFSECRFFAASIKHAYTKEYFQGIFMAFKEHQKMIPKRNKIQTSKAIKIKYLDEIIE